MKPTTEARQTTSSSRIPMAASTSVPSGLAIPFSPTGITPKRPISGPTSSPSGMTKSRMTACGLTWANAHLSALEVVERTTCSITQRTPRSLFRENRETSTTVTQRDSAGRISAKLPQRHLSLRLRRVHLSNHLQ